MRRLSFCMFLLAAAAVILFLSWSLFPGNAGAGETSPPNAGAPAGEAAGTSQAEQEKLKNLAAYQGGEREILDDMAEAMTDLPASADASLDYLRAIHPHSQASIALAECYLDAGGSDEALTRTADDLVSQQKKDLDTIDKLLRRLEADPQTDQGKRDAFMKDYQELLSDSFGREIGDTHAADLDRSFTKTLILHCRLAVDLSELALDYSDDGEVKDLAEEMIEQHTAQVDKLQALLQSLDD